MLYNWPPPGTKVRLLREIHPAKVNDVAVLRRAVRTYSVEHATDEFEVEFRGEKMIVQRRHLDRIR
ncbi:MAG TPA: hypothetical protein VFU31_02410 [Candidatus Binatia bacterium]|nr:hypothetical protein [Candidatus Binatia bacterium]